MVSQLLSQASGQYQITAKTSYVIDLTSEFEVTILALLAWLMTLY